jgi:Family of unknown function (DUF5317)
MVLALPLVLGLLIAPLLGGSWSTLADVRLRLVTAFYVAIALQVVAFPASALPWHTSDRVAVILWLGSYAVFALAAGANLRTPGMALVVAGMCTNLVAILSNGGHMPALPSALRAAGLHFETNRNSAMAASPHFAWFVDRWALPSWVPLGNVFSVGDVLIAAGGFVFVLVASGAVTVRRRRAAARATTWDTLDDGQIVWLRFEVDGVRHRTPLGIRRTVTAG